MSLGRLRKRAEKSKAAESERDVTHALLEAQGMSNPRNRQDHLIAFRSATGQYQCQRDRLGGISSRFIKSV
jgi:hypothetical protein